MARKAAGSIQVNRPCTMTRSTARRDLGPGWPRYLRGEKHALAPWRARGCASRVQGQEAAARCWSVASRAGVPYTKASATHTGQMMARMKPYRMSKPE